MILFQESKIEAKIPFCVDNNFLKMYFLMKIFFLFSVLLKVNSQVDNNISSIYYDVQPQQIHLSFSRIKFKLNFKIWFLHYLKFISLLAI